MSGDVTCVYGAQGLAGTALPTTKKFREMQDELEYKKMQLENTQV
jgi:intraflagellar transport protein 74